MTKQILIGKNIKDIYLTHILYLFDEFDRYYSERNYDNELNHY